MAESIETVIPDFTKTPLNEINCREAVSRIIPSTDDVVTINSEFSSSI